MIIKSLRTSITVNMAFLLLLSMLLINIVMLIVAQEILVNAEISKSRNSLRLVEEVVRTRMASPGHPTGEPLGAETLRPVIKKAGVACFVIVGADRRPLDYGEQCRQKNELVRLAEIVAEKGGERIATRYSIRDIFWHQSSYILMAMPFLAPARSGTAAALLMPLDALYHRLRHTQHIFLIYILVNTALLTFLGIYRLNKLTVKPIQRLVKRAEEYRETDDVVFGIEKEDNEFSKLSKSLNAMLIRISGDKDKLQASVASLEKANRKLEKAQLELVRAEKLASVGRLSAGIAHEIGNPIGIIKGYLDLLKDEGLSVEEKTEFIDRTETEVERINAIISQLLDFARPSANEQSIVGIHPILHELEDVCRCQPIFNSFNFTLDLSAKKDQVRADGRQLRQVFLNLILNAADAFDGLDSPDDNRLIIRTSLETDPGQDAEHWLVIQFIDNGAGIPDENLDNIFDPFFSTKEPGRGTGLGLSVSFAIIEGFGGRLQAVVNDLHGTTMHIRLPLAEMDDAPTTHDVMEMTHDAKR